MVNDPRDYGTYPRITTKHGDLGSLFPEIPIGLNPPSVSHVAHDQWHVGARTSRDYASGPGVNLEKNGRTHSFSTGDTHGSIFDDPEITGYPHMDTSMDDNYHDDDTYKVPVVTRVPRRESREDIPKTAKSSKETPSTRYLSTNQKFRGVGKPKISVLREMYPLHVRGVTEPSDYDKDMYSGVVTIDFRGRLDPLNAMGVNVAKSVQKRGEGGGTMIIPGRVVGQKHLKGRDTGVTYRAVFLDGSEDTFNETMLRHYAGMFSSACMKTEDPLLPLIVRMM